MKCQHQKKDGPATRGYGEGGNTIKRYKAFRVRNNNFDYKTKYEVINLTKDKVGLFSEDGYVEVPINKVRKSTPFHHSNNKFIDVK